MRNRNSLTTAMSGLPKKNSAEKLMMPKTAAKRIRKNMTPPILDFTSVTSFNYGSQRCEPATRRRRDRGRLSPPRRALPRLILRRPGRRPKEPRRAGIAADLGWRSLKPKARLSWPSARPRSRLRGRILAPLAPAFPKRRAGRRRTDSECRSHRGFWRSHPSTPRD